MSKKKALIKETVVRRWGKLANIQPLTETFLEDTNLFEQGEEEELGDEEVEAGAEELEIGVDDLGAEAPAAEPEEAIDRLVNAVVDSIAEEFPEVDLGVEGSAVDSEEGAVDDLALDAEVGPELEGGDDEELAPAGRDAYNRKDDELGVEVIDDDELTEAVLKRVVERLLRRRK
jgi:hypothetical protein